MASKWPLKSLKELGVTLIDCVHKTPTAVEKGIPYIGIPQMKNGIIDFSANPRLISEEDYQLWTAKAKPTHGDIVLSRRCNPGETAYVPMGSKFALGQNLVLLRPDPKKIHPGYLRWVVNSPIWWDEVSKYKNPGAVFDSLKCADIPNFEVPEPTRSAQILIDKCLLDISDKIELNHQMNQTLEQMAQALFKSWFVDFDPVVDNALDAGFFEQELDLPDELLRRAEARKAVRAQEGFKPLPAVTRQLFPAAFEPCAEPTLGLGGWVPKGWKVKELGEISSELRRGISPKYVDNGGVIVINQKCIRNHEISYELARRHDRENKKIDGREICLGDVLINSTGVGTLGRIAQVTHLPETSVVDSHVTVIRVKETECPLYTFGQLMLSMETKIEQLGEGSTGQTELSRKVLSEQLVVLPPYALALNIDASFKSFSEKQALNRRE
ncbi:TPA: restriction endonuclease subunit S, partial [Aeromonas dhakensis]|nr:restriction endonuclease subunit S [Aeromonas dhakensis]